MSLHNQHFNQSTDILRIMPLDTADYNWLTEGALSPVEFVLQYVVV